MLTVNISNKDLKSKAKYKPIIRFKSKEAPIEVYHVPVPVLEEMYKYSCSCSKESSKQYYPDKRRGRWS